MPSVSSRCYGGCVRSAAARGVARPGAVATVLPQRTRCSSSSVARFARTGLPVDGPAAATVSMILTTRDPRAEAIAAVAAEAAGGRLLPRDGHRTAGTRRRWTDVARMQALAAARGQ